jgi:hypothetical protein
MSKTRILVSSLLMWMWATTVHADPIPGLFNTGVDNSNVTLVGGSVDPHYSLIASADPAFPGPGAIVATVIPTTYWAANSATSKWIAPAANENYPSGGTPHPAGDYTYRISFDLAGINFSTVSITGKWGVDNSGVIRLNGVSTGISTSSYNPLVNFSISSGFRAGINDLDFVVHNLPAGGSNPTGLRVEGISGTGTATVGVDEVQKDQALDLSVPFPNPARGLARFYYTLPRAGMARLAVRDLAGRTVRTLVESEYPAGRFESSWDGLSTGGSRVGAGVYFVELQAEGSHVSRRIVWMP